MPFLMEKSKSKKGTAISKNLTYLTEELDFQILILHFEITFKGQIK